MMPMAELFLQRCLNHARREAIARCPECGQFFCRECITEHENRIICAACLKKLSRTPFLKSPAFLQALRIGHCLLGFIVAWFIFYLAGELLLRLPASFHEGALWKD
jgi:hypothetical protein